MTRFIPYKVYNGKDNMRIDSELLDNAIKEGIKEPIYRLYGWKPACISLGRNQNGDFLDKEFLHKENIDIVRRLTGGRALLHDNEITYSYICPIEFLNNGEHVISSYKEICQFLIDKFKLLNIELDFGGTKQVNTRFDYCMLISTGADLCYGGKKLIGSAQFRKNGYILQHGSILYDYDKSQLERIFKENVSTDTITSIREIRPDLSKEELIRFLSRT